MMRLSLVALFIQPLHLSKALLFKPQQRVFSSLQMSSNKHNFSWQQTMLRIKDPLVTVPFYQNNFGFKLIHKYHFDQWGFSLYFLATVPEGTSLPEPGTSESAAYLWSMQGTCLELTHNHGSESDDNFKVNNGNVEPYRGFGHIAVMTPDVYGACDILEANGCKFQKKPDEGRMKGLAFVLDPDGYWVEVVSRAPESINLIPNKFTFAQTMIRVKDPVKSLHFYTSILEELSRLPSDKASSEAGEFAKHMFNPILELTHNHGTESNPDFKYHNGNDQDAGQLRGFGHTGFLVDDLISACSYLESEGVEFKKRPTDGNMKDIAFVYDPDRYWVEIIQRNGLKEFS